MIKNIIFDMGNVLIRFDTWRFLDREGVTDEKERRLLIDSIFRNPGWIKMDEGLLVEEEFEREVFRILPKELHTIAHRLITSWDSQILPVEGMEEFVRRCKEAGFHIYLLSNASLRQREYWGRVPGNEYFEGSVISAEVHMLKPQKEIYLHTLEKFGLLAQECVFIDDVQANIEGANSVGIHGILFDGRVDKLYEEIFGAVRRAEKDT